MSQLIVINIYSSICPILSYVKSLIKYIYIYVYNYIHRIILGKSSNIRIHQCHVRSVGSRCHQDFFDQSMVQSMVQNP